MTWHVGRVPVRAGPDGRADDWLAPVAASAAAACQAPADLLGEYLPMLADAAVDGRRPEAWELEAVRESGRRAAAAGVSARRAVELYLSAAWRLWRELPVVMRSTDPEKVRTAAEAVLRVLDDAIGLLVEGHQSERREMIRHEEALRREFVDDLLRGDADVSRMVERAEPFGLDLGKPHHVALAAPRGASAARSTGRPSCWSAPSSTGSATGTCWSRPRTAAWSSSSPAGRPQAASSAHSVDVGAVIEKELGRLAGGHRWRVAAGRAFPGAFGIPRSYEEARDALDAADRLDLDADVVHARDVLVYRVLGRDQAAIVDLVRDVLGPLDASRGGAGLHLETLQGYFDAGDVATEAARRLHVSVRTVTYRLARIAQLTGYSVAKPDQRFALHAAVLGARLLGWPRRPLPTDP